MSENQNTNVTVCSATKRTNSCISVQPDKSQILGNWVHLHRNDRFERMLLTVSVTVTTHIDRRLMSHAPLRGIFKSNFSHFKIQWVILTGTFVSLFAVFRSVRKIAEGNYKLRHVRPFAWNNSATTGRIFVKFHI